MFVGKFIQKENYIHQNRKEKKELFDIKQHFYTLFLYYQPSRHSVDL